MGFVDKLLGRKSSPAEQSPKEPIIQSCETCGAHKQTISIQQETIEMLQDMLTSEREERQALLLRFNVLKAPETASASKDAPHAIRTARTPWRRMQAGLEAASAHDAHERWKERVKAANDIEVRPELPS